MTDVFTYKVTIKDRQKLQNLKIGEVLARIGINEKKTWKNASKSLFFHF